MATIRKDKKGRKHLTLSWDTDRFARQEALLSKMSKSREALEFVMQAILVCHVASQRGMLPGSFITPPLDMPTTPQLETAPEPPKVSSAVAEALKKFSL